jgi:hypothetical protein
MAVDPVPADPALNALLVATATEDWPAWYGCTRLAVADYLEDRNFPGDRQGASLVRQARPTAWAQCPVRPGWEVAEVRLLRDAPAASPTPWVRALVDGHGRGDDGFSRLAEHDLWPGVGRTLSGAYLRPFPLAALRLSAVIPDESGVCAVVSLRPAFNPHDHPRREDLQVTSWDARLWCRREVMALFADVLVKAPCPYCEGRGITPTGFLVHAAVAHGASLKPGTVVGTPGGPLRCPVCRGRPPRPCPAPSLLPTLPAVALPAPAPLN